MARRNRGVAETVSASGPAQFDPAAHQIDLDEIGSAVASGHAPEAALIALTVYLQGYCQARNEVPGGMEEAVAARAVLLAVDAAKQRPELVRRLGAGELARIFVAAALHELTGTGGEAEAPDVAEEDPPTGTERLRAAGVPQAVIDKLGPAAEGFEPGRSGRYSDEELRIDCALRLPWLPVARPIPTPTDIRAALDADHYGLDAVKHEVMVFVSKLNRRARKQVTTAFPMPALLLVGPPGVGKTTIAMSLARALGRPFQKLGLGGRAEAHSLRGVHSSFNKATIGDITKAMISAGAPDPVIVLDEVDKAARSEQYGSPTDVLLELLDPAQSAVFTDGLLEFPFDMSHVLYVATANDLSRVPGPLVDRMQVIEISGYTVEEKVQIAVNHLIPAVEAGAAVDPGQVVLAPGLIELLCERYFREPGVRNLRRGLERLIETAAAQLDEEPGPSITVDADFAARLFQVASQSSRIGFVAYA